jgi:hypothetical protein
MRRLIILTCLTLVPAVACSSSGGSAATTTTPQTTTTAARDLGTPAPGLTFGPTTSFIANCAHMPSAKDISAAVGVPMADGQVIGAETCEYLGLNDQSKTVRLSKFADAGDQAQFTDLQSSLGASKPLKDPALPNAMVGATSTVYITANGSIYTVQTAVTDGTPASQVPLSVALLKSWLKA